MRPITLLTLALAAIDPVAAADPPQRIIDLESERIGVLGLPLAEDPSPVFRVALSGETGEAGDGRGTLVLDLTRPPEYDEFGFVSKVSPTRELKLDCTFKQVKTTTKVFHARVGGPGSDKYEEYREDWSLLAITGPKITSRLFLALHPDNRWPRGRLLVQNEAGRVQHAIDLMPPPQPEPCHPGCFPAGTAVRVPGGVTPIELIRPGDPVSAVGADGRLGTAKVEDVFVTRNRLVEVRTGGGNLITTQTQPLAMENGKYRAAGELQAGDRVWVWSEGERRATAVVGVSTAEREAKVFNLVLGPPTTFVAGDFLVRSKPPVDLTQP